MNIPLRLVLALGAVVLAGCAASYPPGPPPPGSAPDDGAAAVEPVEPGEPTAPDPRPEPAVQPRAQPNAEAPTLALLRQSERSADSGDLAGAIAYVERAIRLNSRDPDLWLRLAGLQLQAQRPATAEQLAQKAIALAGDHRDQQRRGWLLVADALEAQGDAAGAREIRERWRTFRG